MEKTLEEAGSSGLLCLSGRKLREFSAAAAYDLSDTTQADLSRNRFTEIPPDVWQFAPLETLNLYHNCIKSIPEAIKNLQMLTYLNISRNLLSTLPKYLFDLPLKVLVVSNNKLVSVPEEIGKLKDLMELDISCNEIQVLPQQIGKLHSLKELNLRRNNLHMLPDELGDLPLVKLDFSCNKIIEIPICFRKLRHLQVIVLDNNPMQIPPAQICLKGKVHIFKFLSVQACLRMDKKPDSLDLPSLGRRIPSQPLTDSIEDFYPNKNHGPDSGIGSDNGDKRLSTTEELHHTTTDPDVCDYLDPSSEDVAACDQGDPQTGSSISYVKRFLQPSSPPPSSTSNMLGKERGKSAEKPQKSEPREDWREEKRWVPDSTPTPESLHPDKHKKPTETDCGHRKKPLENQRGHNLDGPRWPDAQPIIWPNEERRRSKQIRREYFKYKSSRKSSSGNENDEQDSDHANVSPQSPVSSENLELRLKVSLPEDIGAALMDGVVLCHLANHIRPRSVASIHVPSPAVERLCLPHHILEERGLVKVGLTVQALLEIPSSKASQLSCL
ncbi:hypothetical protein Chor_004736 [Crotalus horridus]